MIKTSLFADQEREAKLNKLGDALRVMEQHVDFAALTEAVGRAAPQAPKQSLSKEEKALVRENAMPVGAAQPAHRQDTRPC